MNKTKVMQILNSIDSGLNDIEEDQQSVMQALTEYVRADVEDLKEELNLDDVVMGMIQTCTAISTIINYERIGK